MKHLGLWISIVAVLAAVEVALAQGAGKVVVVCNVKVLSDKVQDVSSLETWKTAFLKADASDQDKALAIWDSVVRFVHEDTPPYEFINWENTVNDPIKSMNVYGYALCNDTAAEVIGLSRYAGFKAQGWSILGHCVADLWYGDAWHYLDASFIEYIPKADGKLAGVEEVFAAVKDWYDKNPDYKDNPKKLQEFCRNEGWKKGPEILALCPLYDKNGNLPAKTHGWYSTMREFNGKQKNIYETGYSHGYRVNLQLRPGEKIVRNWSNKGLHVNMDKAGLSDQQAKEVATPHCIDGKAGQGDMVYTPKYGDLAPGRIGNGTIEYDALAGGGPAKTAFASEPDGSFVIRMPSSYVYLGGKLEVDPKLEEGATLAIQFSDNNGLDWTDLAKIEKSGPQTIDFKAKALRRYDYQVKFATGGKKVDFKTLKFSHDIQHSQRALPALDKGANTITFSAGPQESTITIEPSVDPKNKGVQLTVADFHPQMDGTSNDKPGIFVGGKGTITFPVKTPGDMTAVRVSTLYRARDAKDQWEVQASFDEGKTWKSLGTCKGPASFSGEYFVLTDIPAGAKSALVRWAGTQKNTLMIFNCRIDADYKAPNAGFAPVKVTYVWEEDGKEKKDEHVARQASETWNIQCDAKPVMKSITLERAE